MRWLSSSLLSLLSSDLAIDLGTANSLVFCKGLGIVVSEPSIIAVSQKTGRVEFFSRSSPVVTGLLWDAAHRSRPSSHSHSASPNSTACVFWML